MTSQNLALTIQSGLAETWFPVIVVGSNVLNFTTSDTNLYWILIIDRTDLTIKENFTTSDNSDVPSQLSPYLGNTQYMIVMTTYVLSTLNLPQGDFYNFLVGEGAGSELKRGEQIMETLNCGTWGYMSYSFVAVIGDNSAESLEQLNIQHNSSVLTLELQPISFNGVTYYTPVSL